MAATNTQFKTKSAIFLDQISSEIKNVQSNPAAKNPLYKPWLAAIAFVGLNKSLGKLVNTFGAFVVQANISNQRK